MTVPDHMFKPLKISLASNGASTHGTQNISATPSCSGDAASSIVRRSYWRISHRLDGLIFSSPANTDGENNRRGPSDAIRSYLPAGQTMREKLPLLVSKYPSAVAALTREIRG